MTNIIRFYPKDSGTNPDYILEQSIGQYESVVVIGFCKKCGELDTRASTNISFPEILWIIEQFRTFLLTGTYGNYFQKKEDPKCEEPPCTCGDPDCSE
jgi:hypothetical protein